MKIKHKSRSESYIEVCDKNSKYCSRDCPFYVDKINRHSTASWYTDLCERYDYRELVMPDLGIGQDSAIRCEECLSEFGGKNEE